MTVPAALVDHAWGAFLLFKDADDPVPIAKVPTFVAGRDIRLVENRWVRFRDGPLVSLLEDESLQDFNKAGEGLLIGMARGAVGGLPPRRSDRRRGRGHARRDIRSGTDL